MMSRTKRPRDGAISHFHRRMSCELFIFLLFIFVLTLKLFYFYSTGEEIFLFCSFGEKLCCLESCSKLLIFFQKNWWIFSRFSQLSQSLNTWIFVNSFFSHFKNALKNCKRKFRKNFRYEKKTKFHNFPLKIFFSLSRARIVFLSRLFSGDSHLIFLRDSTIDWSQRSTTHKKYSARCADQWAEKKNLFFSFFFFTASDFTFVHPARESKSHTREAMNKRKKKKLRDLFYFYKFLLLFLCVFKL